MVTVVLVVVVVVVACDGGIPHMTPTTEPLVGVVEVRLFLLLDIEVRVGVEPNRRYCIVGVEPNVLSVSPQLHELSIVDCGTNLKGHDTAKPKEINKHCPKPHIDPNPLSARRHFWSHQF